MNLSVLSCTHMHVRARDMQKPVLICLANFCDTSVTRISLEQIYAFPVMSTQMFAVNHEASSHWCYPKLWFLEITANLFYFRPPRAYNMRNVLSTMLYRLYI